MKLQEAKEKLRPMFGVKFSELMSQHDISDIIKNKGRSGQLVEILLGMKNSPNVLDFEDGELKTNKCRALGEPIETMFITQVLSIIDELLDKKDFYTTRLYKKIDHMLYVPICKTGSPKDWYVIDVLDVNLNDPKLAKIKLQLEKDYYTICDQVIEFTKDGGNLHTANGKYIQIRTKDGMPYKEIYSKTLGRVVSDKNRAFYFKKEFIFAICKLLSGIK